MKQLDRTSLPLTTKLAGFPQLIANMGSLIYVIITWTPLIFTQVGAFSLRKERLSLRDGVGDLTLEYKREGGQQYEVEWALIDPRHNKPISLKGNPAYVIENHRWLMFLTHMGSSTLNLQASPETDHVFLVTFTSEDHSFRYTHPFLLPSSADSGNIHMERNLNKVAMETVTTPPSAVVVAIGDDVTLTCGVIEGQNHGIRWYMDGHLVYSDQSKDVSEIQDMERMEVDTKESTSRGRNAITSTMIIRSLEPNDPSHVTCQFGPKDFTADSVTMTTKLMF